MTYYTATENKCVQMSIRKEAINWLEESKVDLRRAKSSLRNKDYSLCCFMSQQSVEKALKAFHISLRKVPSRTHDLTALYSSVNQTLKLSKDLIEALPELSQYYVTARYPNAGLGIPSRSFSFAQAKRAHIFAERIVKNIEKKIS